MTGNRGDRPQGRRGDFGTTGYSRRDERDRSDGDRPVLRDETETSFAAEPPLAEDIDARELAPEVREELRSLARHTADAVSRRLVAAGQLVDVDPKLALEHALAARRRAARIGVVREAVGLAAYHAQEWQVAISELRTYHRLSGKQTHIAVIADCERALGRPERAIDLYRTADRSQLTGEEIAELLIVAAGARSDLGQTDAAVAMLQVRELTAASAEPWTARLRYAYADALLGAGRREEAREWFARAAEVDEDLTTDAAERLLDLDGVRLDEHEDDDEHDDDEHDGEHDHDAEYEAEDFEDDVEDDDDEPADVEDESEADQPYRSGPG